MKSVFVGSIPTAPSKRCDMERQQISLAPTDVVSVLLGPDHFPLRDYREHPQLHWIATRTDDGEIILSDTIVDRIPEATKLVLMTDGINHGLYHHVTAEARKRNLLYLHKRSDEALRVFLDELFPEANAKDHRPTAEEDEEDMAKRN